MSTLSRLIQPLLLVALALPPPLALAHDNHEDNIPEGAHVSPEPIDGILWWHIFSMVAAFGILFPAGMVLGIVRSRWHVPVQVLGTVLAVMGWFLGHAHKGRQFADNIHASFAWWLMLMLVSQIAFGSYLKLHLSRGIHGKIRRFVAPVHGVVGKLIPLASWVQMLFGGVTALGFCHDDHLGQCLAHFIMGSSFIIYGMFMTAMLFLGQAWLKRSGRSQEFWDSLVIAVWGCVNTFTEHNWGHEWYPQDYQHTSMGVVWWCAGLLGLWLSRAQDGTPKRNVVPGVVIFLTGWAMSAHGQQLMLSTMVHGAFGYTLMAAGAARIIEICFVLRDAPATGEPSSFQHVTPYLLYASGFIFMSATEEQLDMIAGAGIDHVSYLLILYSLAFLLYLFTQILIHLVVVNTQEKETPYVPVPGANGVQHDRAVDEQRAREADEFELEGLITDDESDTEAKQRK